MVTSSSFENHLHRHPRLPAPPPLSPFFSVAFFPPSVSHPQSREWAGLSLVWHHWLLPMPLPQSCSDVRQISLQWPHSHCLYSLIDAGMLEVTHESESVFHAYPWHPIEATHCVCVWVWRPAPCGPVLVLPASQSFALPHGVLFWNADII